ncbi:MAG TPA: 30S ribosomal protein S6 [bacterium]|nr:30S ribosomal protein S6 [bacterium]HNS34299.1 30S ribosomal protein S6 [bacterium]HNW09525.1 30S ribosomal protein S6 [bacterium]HNZ73494.1 30S ribosomal protein S6 [bacterium]HOH67363.1 30S ribosomal protein S6 [bacterium]
MKNYELLYIISGQFTEDEVTGIRQEIDNLIKKYDGQIGYQEFLGKKKLAYPIAKNFHGYYIVSEFETEKTTNIKALSTDLKLDQRILRAQIITKPKITAGEIAKKQERKEPLPAPADAKNEAPMPRRKESQKVSMEKLDEKLDEILKDDNII